MNPNDIWRNVSERIGFFTESTAEQIPEKPGTYAWLLPLWIYSERLSEFLRVVRIFYSYDAKNEGIASSEQPITLGWDRLSLSIARDPSPLPSPRLDLLWNKVTENPGLRQQFATSLMEASLFLPPLYVGKADNLRLRYEQHVASSNSEKNTFNRRFAEFVREHDLKLTMGDLLFASITTNYETHHELETHRANYLLEQILMRIVGAPFSHR